MKTYCLLLVIVIVLQLACAHRPGWRRRHKPWKRCVDKMPSYCEANQALCTDHHYNFKYWCRKTCGLCVPEPCIDKWGSALCDAHKGQCYKRPIARKCQATCGICTTTTATPMTTTTEQSTTTTVPTTTTAEPCVDDSGLITCLLLIGGCGIPAVDSQCERTCKVCTGVCEDVETTALCQLVLAFLPDGCSNPLTADILQAACALTCNQCTP